MTKISIPSVTSNLAPDMRAFVQRVREALSLFGDATVWKDELERAHLISITPGGTVVPGDAVGDTDMTPPAAPTGLAAYGAVTTIILEWDEPIYGNHSYTEIWRSTSDNLGTAVKVGSTDSFLYADALGDTGITYYYWVRFVSTANVVGPYNGTAGTSAATGQVGANNLANLAVGTAHIANLAVVEGKIADLAVTNAKFGGYLQSNNYVPGSVGWHINKDGTVEFNSATFRGGVWAGSITSTAGVTMGAGGHIKGGATAFATGTGIWMGYDGGVYKMSLGTQTGARMTWDGSTFAIYDSLGAVVLASGSGVPWNKVSGSGKPVDYATNSFLGAPSNLIPDDGFYSSGWWRGDNAQTTWPTGWTPSDGSGGQPMRFMRIDSAAGTFDVNSQWFGIQQGDLYNVRLKMYVSPDFQGFIAPLVHFPNVIWACPGSTVADPQAQFPAGHTAASWGTGVWTERELQVTASAADCMRLQTRICGRVTAGYIEFWLVVENQRSLWSGVSGSGKPADNATVGATSSNLTIGVGGNLMPNSDLSSGAANWTTGWIEGGGSNYLIGTGIGGADWSPAGGYSIGCARYGTTQAAAGWFDVVYAKGIPVSPSTRYELSAYLASHRCSAYVLVGFYKLVGGVETYISEASSTAVTLTGGQTLSNWGRPGFFVTSPADATYAKIWIRGSACTAADPYFWGTRIFFAQALSGQTELSPWSDGGRSGAFSEISQITSSNVATYIANAAIGNAQIGGDIWSSNFAYGSAGWIIRRDGYAEFSNIYARGNIQATSLNAATGTFSGTMTADAVNAVNTINLAGQAVTVPVSAYTSAGINPSEGGYSTVQSAYINAGGVNVFVHGSFVMTNTSTTDTVLLNIRIRNPSGTTIYESPLLDIPVAPETSAIFAASAVSNVDGTYLLEVRTSQDASTLIGHRCLLLLGTKR